MNFELGLPRIDSSRINSVRFGLALLILALGVLLSSDRQSWTYGAQAEVTHTVSGVVKLVDTATMTMIVDIGDGIEVAVNYTAKTTVVSAEAPETSAEIDTLKGSHVIVYYTETGAVKTASRVKYFPKNDVVKTTKGTVTAVDKAAKTVAIKTADGSVVVYNVGKDAAVETAKGSTATAKAIAKGSTVVAHYTAEGAKKTVRFLKVF
ncbi:MAG TPA: hypothetical protein VNS63_27320 [Blastocatellia bacterium]|nr:hypothetical protein [Blastocatellia bacterium]